VTDYIQYRACFAFGTANADVLESTYCEINSYTSICVRSCLIWLPRRAFSRECMTDAVVGWAAPGGPFS
jgi:hypothetical protein